MKVKYPELTCSICNQSIRSIFKGLNSTIIDEIEKIKTCHIIEKGQQIFVEGSYPRGLYCVQKGKVKVFQTGQDGREQIVHLIHDGQIMGHRAIFGDDTYSCSAVALDRTIVCFLPKVEFYKLAETHVSLSLFIAHLLSDELKEAERRITNTAQHTILQRTAENILFLYENYGFEEDGATINIKFKREELANLVGTTRETVTRMLYDLQTRKIIKLSLRKIKIINTQLLRDIALHRD